MSSAFEEAWAAVLSDGESEGSGEGDHGFLDSFGPQLQQPSTEPRRHSGHLRHGLASSHHLQLPPLHSLPNAGLFQPPDNPPASNSSAASDFILSDLFSDGPFGENTTSSQRDSEFSQFVDLTARSSSPEMAPPTSSKRHAETDAISDHWRSPKRRKQSSGPSQRPKSETKHVEEIDLEEEEGGLGATLQKQRAEQVQGQQAEERRSSKLNTLTCTVCLDTPTALTATACGHTFCHSCLMDWIVAAEKGDTKRSNCPACRTRLSRSKKTDIIPLEIMTRGAAKGQKAA